MPNSTINNVLWTAYQKGQTIIPFGNVATYIPELGKARKNALGVTMLTKDGRIFELGDTDTRFTIQSISKVISLIVALETFGISTVFDRVGMEPSGEAFNSLVELDLNSNKPYNRMINSGAITIASMLLGHADFESMLEKTRALCHDPEIDLNEEVYASETANMSRNKSIASSGHPASCGTSGIA